MFLAHSLCTENIPTASDWCPLISTKESNLGTQVVSSNMVNPNSEVIDAGITVV